MSTRFVQQYGGHVDAKREKDVTYEFSGDDDVWIFIDGELVADLGGIHNAASVSINFATGEISINNGEPQSLRLGRILGYDNDTLPDNTYHTLDFFYLERGNYDSNMKLKYNLVTIPESSLIKVDQLGNSVPGAEFTLYAANDTNKSNPIATGKTNFDGEFVFLDENDFPITIDNLYREYGNIGTGEESDLILSETNTPAGYRSIGDVGLYFYQNPTDSNEILLLSNSVWDKGAYAMAKATTTTGNSIMLNNNEIIKLVGTGAVENPVMFAVVYQKQDNDTWLPVYGDPLKGWHVANDSSWNSVLEAARANPYVFQLASSGAYQVEISNLPGDIKTYYHFTGKVEDAKYTIAYYYTKAKTIAGANEDNTKLISANRKDGYDLNRVFSVNLYVTNVKNYLLVQKVDDLGNTVNDAVFSLYKAKDVTVNEDGTVTLKSNAQPYDTVKTSNTQYEKLQLDGGAIFPTENKVLENGEYYLIETSAPTGYKLNDNAVHVIIDNTGVYADAGDDKDGVTVLRGVGSVMRSMVQFAVEDKVDTTLNGIKAALATSVDYRGYNEDGSFTVTEEANWSNALHLKYANENAMLDYGLYDDTVPRTIDNLTIPIESGWSKLLIQQCNEHDNTIDKSTKTDLKDRDITNLFSRTVTVRVENERTGNLKISKTVTGDNAPENKEFEFKVTVTKDEKPVTGEYSIGDNKTIEFDNGTATFKLANAGSLTIYGLPTGAKYTVEETSVNGYSPSVDVTGDKTAKKDGGTVTGTIGHDTSEDSFIKVAYTNKFDRNARFALNGTKILNGRNITEKDSFTFELTAGGDYGGKVVMPKKTEVTVIGNGTSNTADFSFDPITFTDEGTYTFNITEKLPVDVTKENPVSGGIRYDTHKTVVTVRVTKGKDNILEAVLTNYENAKGSTVNNKAVFENTYESLTLAKTVSGNIGDKGKEFEFEIRLTGKDGADLSDGMYSYTGGTVVDGVTAPSDGTISLVNGKAKVTLKHGQSITVIGLPTDAKYTISEKDADAYTTEITATPTATINNDSRTVSGNLSANATTTITYNNERNSGPITGIFLDNLPWILALCFVLFGGSALYLSKKRGINLLNEVKVRIKNGGHNGKNGR